MAQDQRLRAFKYLRISDDREGRELGITRQDADLDALIERRRYVLAGRFVDNDIGASTRSTKPRKDYKRMMRLARAGQCDVICAYTSGRLTRRPLEHEAQIELAEKHGIRYDYVASPSFDLNTAAGRRVARILAANDAGESEDIGERVAAARLQQAQQGRNGAGGRRPYGYADDRVTVVDAEKAEIVRWADALLSGISLAQVAADVRRRDVPSVTGAQWTPQTIRSILLRPRNAGLMVYRGEILEGATATWKPILDRSTWEAVNALLTDPNRRTTPGNTPRWLGSMLYRCGHPDHIDSDPPVTMYVGTTGGARHRAPAYRCREASHLTRAAPSLDDYVARVIVKRLGRRDAVDLLRVDTPGVDTAALAREAAALRTRIAEAKDLWEAGVLTAADMKVRVARMQAELAEIESRQHAVSTLDPLAEIAGRADAAQVWKRLDLGRQRAILKALLVVTVLPVGAGRLPGGGRFNPDAVDIKPARTVS